MSIISLQKSIIPSCDVATLEKLQELVTATADVSGVGGYKIGFELGLKFGIPTVCETIRKQSNLPIIYDHQKAATDIPDTGSNFASAVAGVDAIILFPMAGPETLKQWVADCTNAKLGVIVGGEMTHPAYLAGAGGFLADDMPDRVYTMAAELGVTEFVVPGNKPDRIAHYRQLLESKGITPVFYSPGLVTQGGSISAGAEAAGSHWHAIVGRGITQAPDMKAATEQFVSQLYQ